MADRAKQSRLSQLGGFVLIALCLLWTIFVLLLSFFVVRDSLGQLLSIRFSTTAGSITHSELKFDRSEHRPKIEYTYYVDGKEYLGNRFRFNDNYVNRAAAQRQVEAYPVGTPVVVHFDQENPAEAVLRAGIEGRDFFLLLIVAPFLVTTFGCWIGWAQQFRPDPSMQRSVGAKISDEGYQTRVRLSDLSPIVVGIAVAVILDFVALFVIAFGFYADPPMSVMLVVWALIFGGGFVAFWLSGRNLSKGMSDMVIDDFTHTVAIPPTLEREDVVVVPMTSVNLIEVQRRERKNPDQSQCYRYCPTLAFKAHDGTVRSERLAEWSDAERADKFVAWLANRLKIKSQPH